MWPAGKAQQFLGKMLTEGAGKSDSIVGYKRFAEASGRELQLLRAQDNGQVDEETPFWRNTRRDHKKGNGVGGV